MKVNTKKLQIVAPMVSNSGLAWRILSKRYGADLCYSEMIHSKSFLMGGSKVKNWLSVNNEEGPLRVQICGNDQEIMLKAASELENFGQGIDINFGCPQKIAKKGYYGAYLQDNWKLTENIIYKLSKNLQKPLSCKIRVFEDPLTTLQYCKMIESAGCKILTVHGRTRHQYGQNTGLADWTQIKMIKEHLKIPIYSNGNILYNKDIEECFNYTNVDGVMVAETHLHNPLIFSDIKKSVFDILKEYIEICQNTCYTNNEIKSHTFKLLHIILKTYPEYNEVLNNVNFDELYDLISRIEKKVISNIQEHKINKNILLPGPKIRKFIETPKYLNITESYKVYNL